MRLLLHSKKRLVRSLIVPSLLCAHGLPPSFVQRFVFCRIHLFDNLSPLNIVSSLIFPPKRDNFIGSTYTPIITCSRIDRIATAAAFDWWNAMFTSDDFFNDDDFGLGKTKQVLVPGT